MKLYRGDALAILRDLPDASVDAVITDPPYSSGGMFRSDRTADPTTKYRGWSQNPDGGSRTPTATYTTFAGDNRDQRSYAYWSHLWQSEALRVARPGAHFLTFTDWRQLPTLTDVIQAAGWTWRGILVWDKGIARPQRGRFRQHLEFILWASHGPLDADENPVYLQSLYYCAPPGSDDRQHVTEKPLQLLRSLTQIVPPGGIVLDPFMGSGTTGVAAVLEGRDFVGVELTEHYYRVAEARVTAAERGYRAPGAQMVLGAEEAV